MRLMFLEECNFLFICSVRASDFILEALWTCSGAKLWTSMNRYGVHFVFALTIKK